MASLKGWYEEWPYLPTPTSHTGGIRLFTYFLTLCQCFTPSPGISLGNGYCDAHPHKCCLQWWISQQLSKMDKPVASFFSPATPVGVPMCLLMGGLWSEREARVLWRGTTPADTIFSHPQLCPPWPPACLSFLARLFEQGAVCCLATLQHDKYWAVSTGAAQRRKDRGSRNQTSSSGSTGPGAQVWLWLMCTPWVSQICRGGPYLCLFPRDNAAVGSKQENKVRGCEMWSPFSWDPQNMLNSPGAAVVQPVEKSGLTAFTPNALQILCRKQRGAIRPPRRFPWDSFCAKGISGW